jgi:putative oxidoreductase
MATAQPVQQPGVRAWLAAVVRTRKADLPVDLALAAVRAALAWIFIVYGAQKLFGWFNGPGIHQTALDMANSYHLRPGRLFAYLGGIVEFGGAIAVALGIGTRLAGIALFGDMVMAMIKVTWAHGLHQKSPFGYELNVALGALGLVVFLLGAGRYSLDALAERRLVATGEASAR